MDSKFRDLTGRSPLEPPPPRHVGDSKAYWSWMRRVLQRDSVSGSVSPLAFAEVSAALGEKDRALSLLHEAVKEHAADLDFLRVSPSWDSLRQEPRFHDLLRTVGLSGNLNHITQ